MNKMNLSQFITVLLLVFLLAGCDTWEKNININPNSPSTGGESSSSYDFEPDEFMLDMIGSVIEGWDYVHWNVCAAVCEYHGKTISLSQGNRHQAWHAFDDSPYGGPWEGGYTAVRYIRNMRNAAVETNDVNYQSIATIWECYDFFNLTLLYGDIPYSESIIDNAPINPVYDSQETLYYTLISKLKAAGKAIDVSSNVESSTDLIFSGDMLKWKKFANTLLVRYAMYMSIAAEDSCKNLLNEILNNPETYPVMDSNNDNASFHYDGSTYKSRYYSLSSAKMSEAPFSNVFIERLNSLKDPRLPIYARPVKYYHTDSLENVIPSNAGSSKYAGHLYGITTDNAYASAWNDGANYASKLGEYFRTEDDKGTATSECATVPLNLATYSEMLFFLAEATEKGYISTGTSAKEYYNEAIQASFDQYGATFTTEKYSNAFGTEALSNTSEYLAQNDVKYDGGRDHLTLIAEQKWIASFLLMFEPYFDHRRTMLPKMRASSGAEAYNSTGSSTKYPSRAAYPSSEESTNKENVEYANANGFDIAITDQVTRNTALMWLLKPKGQTWLQMPVFQEPNYKAEYPARSSDAEFGTNFYNWYTTNWNSMFWWKCNDE